MHAYAVVTEKYIADPKDGYVQEEPPFGMQVLYMNQEMRTACMVLNKQIFA